MHIIGTGERRVEDNGFLNLSEYTDTLIFKQIPQDIFYPQGVGIPLSDCWKVVFFYLGKIVKNTAHLTKLKKAFP